MARKGPADIGIGPRVWKFQIERLPSPQLSPNWHGHWRMRHKAKEMDEEDLVAYFLHTYSRPAIPLNRVAATVTVTRKGHQKLDPDNFSARMKGFWDGLVKCGLLADDSTDVLDVKYIFQVDKERAGPFGLVEFEIVELLNTAQ